MLCRWIPHAALPRNAAIHADRIPSRRLKRFLSKARLLPAASSDDEAGSRSAAEAKAGRAHEACLPSAEAQRRRAVAGCDETQETSIVPATGSTSSAP